MQETLIKKISLFLFFALIFIMYFFYPIKIQLYESYLYLLSAQNIVDIKQAFSFYRPTISSIPDFSYYHPNHPLLIIFSKFITTLFPKLNILWVCLFINKVLGFLTPIVLYQLLNDQFKDKITNIILSFSLLFIDIYWYNSNSSEGYVSGLFFLVCSFYILTKSFQTKDKILAIFHGVSLGLSIGFHSLYLFPALLQIYFLFKYSKNSRKDQLIFLTLSTIIIILFGIFIYIIPSFTIFKLNNLNDFIKLFTFYSNEMGVWTISNITNLKFIAYPIYSGIFHILQTTYEGPSLIPIYLRLLFFILLLYCAKSALINRALARYFLAVFLFFFIFTAFVLYLPYDITYWNFISVSLIVFIRFGIEELKFKQFIAIALITSLMLNNFINDIYPKNKVDTDKYFHLNQISKHIQSSNIKTVVFNIYDTNATNSYLNYYGMIWSFLQQKKSPLETFISIDHDNLKNQIEGLVRSKKQFILIENETNNKEIKKERDLIIKNSNSRVNLIDIIEKKFEPKLDKSSEMEHEEYWFDQGPTSGKWHYFIYLITPI